VLVVLLVALIPVLAISQDAPADAKKARNTAPSYSYWSVQAFGGIMQFNGDLSKNVLFNMGENLTGYNYGLVFTKQFTRVIGARFRVAHGKLQSRVEGKFIYDFDNGEPTNPTPHYLHEKFVAYPWETDLQVTINWTNWILGYKPERVLSSYAIIGVGADQTIGHRTNLLTGQVDAHLGRKDFADNMGNTSGIIGAANGQNLEFKVGAGIGLDINIHKNWSINPEFYWRWRDGDILDMTKGGAKQIKNDMYSSVTLGLTYKFGYRGGSLKEMEKRYGEVIYEVTPPVLAEKGDSVTVTIKGIFPEKYFAQKAAMYFQPVLTYAGGQTELPAMNLMGEKIAGDGTMIKYKEGGTFTYTTVFPYTPEMNTSELVVAPIIYETKETIIPKKDEIKLIAKFIELPSRSLAPGVIYTPTRISNQLTTLIAPHGYVKEVIVSKTAVLYFPKNLSKLNLKFGLNKADASKQALADLDAFLQQGWKLKNIEIDGWASPEGEETFNVGLSEKRSVTGNEYMVAQYQAWVKAANKDNKDKKAVKAAVEAAAADVNFVLNHHGPDWNGFLKEIQNSTMPDKDKILNVVNSQMSEAQKEQKLRDMILIYPTIEENLLPPLRRAVIKANLYEPRLLDEEIASLAVTDAGKLKAEEILYAGTLTTDISAQVKIYENAARIYKDNWKALSNAGVANIAAGNYKAAIDYLESANDLAPNNGIIVNNLGVAYAKAGDLRKAEEMFNKAKQLGENENYNLGVLMIPKGDYAKASQMLGSAKCDYNLGLLQLVSGNTSAAETTLKCAPQTPETFYLLAIVGAKKNDTGMLYEYLMKACENSDLKAQARGDREFYNYATTPEFQNIVK
ncbi:MAG: tetratricopeptide repeat protein, partial [Bacteroidales bacterium]|nr:tetratricopeptide repeat protein [Bacteroidales bacterium]